MIVYIILQRSEKQALQTHMHVAGLSTECFQIIQSQFKQGKVRSSTFNNLRNMTEERKLKCLQDFRVSGFSKTVLRKVSTKAKIQKLVSCNILARF